MDSEQETLLKHSLSSLQTAAQINETTQNNQALTGFWIYSFLNLQALGVFLKLK